MSNKKGVLSQSDIKNVLDENIDDQMSDLLDRAEALGQLSEFLEKFLYDGVEKKVYVVEFDDGETEMAFFKDHAENIIENMKGRGKDHSRTYEFDMPRVLKFIFSSIGVAVGDEKD